MNDFYKDILKCLDESKFVEYTNSEMGEVVANRRIKYTERASKEFVQKALWNDESTWYVIESEDGMIEAAITTVEVDGSLLIEEFMSFKKGSGSDLLKHVLSFNYDMIYLFADWSQPDTLLDYYRREEFGLTEKIMKNDRSHDTHYFYLNKKLSPERLEKFINDHFIV